MTTAYTRLLSERDSRALVGMDVARAFLRPGDWNRDNMTLRRLAYAVRQFDHAQALIDRLDEQEPVANVRRIPAYAPVDAAMREEAS